MTTIRRLKIIVDQAGNAVAGLSGLRSGLAGMATVATAGLVALGAVGGAAGLAGVKLISLGSDAEEMQGKFDVVFAQTGARVTRELDKFGNVVGRNKFELMEYASAFGDTLKPMGMTEEAAAKFSTQLVELGTDLSSFNNMPMDEAMRRLQGTLIGSHENALAFGVVINENTLKAELAANGWDKLSGAELEAAKVQARINLLMKGTTDAQGDAERTSKSWANQMRRLKSTITEAATEMGLKLMPVVTPFLQKAGDLANRVLPVLVSWFSDNLVPALQSTANLINMLISGDFKGGIFGLAEDSGLISFLLFARESVLRLWQAFEGGGIAGVIAELGPILSEAWNSYVSPTILSWRDRIFDWAVQAYANAPTYLGNLFSTITTFLAGAWNNYVGPVVLSWRDRIFDWAVQAYANAPTYLGNLFSTITIFLAGAWNNYVGPVVLSWRDRIFDWAVQAYANIPTYLNNFISAITTFLTDQGPAIREAAQGWVSEIWAWIDEAVNKAGTVMAGLLIAIGAWAMSDEAQGRLNEAGVAIGQWVADGVAFLFENQEVVIGVLTKLAGGLLVGVAAIAGILIVTGGQIVAGILSGILEKLGVNLKPATFNELRGILSGIGSNIVTIAKHVGNSIVNGIVNGIRNGASRIADAARSAAQAALNSAKAALGIHSDSREFIKLGQYSVQGFQRPFKSMQSTVGGTINRGMASVLAGAGSASAGGLAAAGGGGGTIVQVTYAPVISTADSIEVETKLVPLILRGLRKAGVKVSG